MRANLVRTRRETTSLAANVSLHFRWQRAYYEHVMRNEKALDRIRAYIANNPARWADDPENISRAVSAEAGRV
jgi:putative transposase